MGVDGNCRTRKRKLASEQRESGRFANSQKRKRVPMETKRSVDQKVSSAAGAEFELRRPRDLGAEEAAMEEMTWTVET